MQILYSRVRLSACRFHEHIELHLKPWRETARIDLTGFSNYCRILACYFAAFALLLMHVS